MTLPKIEKQEILESLLDYTAGIMLKGMDVLRRSLQGETPSDTAIAWASEHQANIANQVLDLMKHDPSERYTPQDFSQMLHYVPSDLSQRETKLLCDKLNEGYQNLVEKKTGSM